MDEERVEPACRTGRAFGAGMTVGVALGFAVGTVLAMSLGDEAVEAVRGLLDRVSGRRNRVNFELLLQ